LSDAQAVEHHAMTARSKPVAPDK